MNERFYIWVISLGVVLPGGTLLNGCGALSSEQVGGETSFLRCERDEDCPADQSQCSGNVCTTPQAEIPDTQTTDTLPTGTQTLPDAGHTSDADVATEQQSHEFEMIDDMEQQPNPSSVSAFLWSRGIGNWFVSTDSATQDAIRVDLNPPRGTSTKGYWIGETAAVVDLWAQLLHPQHMSVDLSQYVGISFWVLAGSPNHQITVALDATEGFGALPGPEIPQKTFPLSTEWQYIEVLFSELDSTTSAAAIDFIVDARDGAFDVWLDDLALLCEGACPE